MEKPFKVKVIKAKSEHLWYKNEIGKVFDVIENTNKLFKEYEFMQYIEDVDEPETFLYKEDCEIVTERKESALENKIKDLKLLMQHLDQKHILNLSSAEEFVRIFRPRIEELSMIVKENNEQTN